MKNVFQNQIEEIDRLIEQIRLTKSPDNECTLVQLFELRRSMHKVLATMHKSPGIAVCGEIQRGKSYLIRSFLQNNGKPFTIKAGNDLHNFYYEIFGPEFSVIKRFSSYNNEPELYSEDHPILVKTFSVTDLLLVLADSYFNDFEDYTVITEDDVNSICKKWKDKYQNAPLIEGSPITSEDVLFMKYYFNKYIHHAHTLNKTSLFDHLTMIVERIPATDYPSIFACLWNNEKEFNNVFTRLLSTLSSFNYAEYIYLPIESVLHKDVKENTIMSVQCLKQLFEAPDAYTSDVYVKKGNEFVKCASKMPKSEICAICSEVVFKIEEGFLSSTQSYAWQNMDESVQNRVNHKPVELKMLRTNDLLDFPGIRERLSGKLAELSSSTVMEFFYRGKVDYLFNKYNEDMSMNILLYCHDNKPSVVADVYKKILNWVNINIGSTPNERRTKLIETQLSPLFFISTRLENDLITHPYELIEHQDYRWEHRFGKIVQNECFGIYKTQWANNWTKEREPFKNCYLLRNASGPKSINKGIHEEKIERWLEIPLSRYKMLRDSFVNNKSVQDIFNDPEVAWDVAASMNNDGSLYVLENLERLTYLIGQSRNKHFLNILQKVKDTLLSFY